jgi:RING finger protein 113A
VRVAKEQKLNPLVQGTARADRTSLMAEDLAHESDRRISNYDNKATASSEQDTAHDLDAQAQYEEAQRQWADGGDTAADGSKVYRGQKAYHQSANTPSDFPPAVLTGQGPARAPVHYRATSRFDYQPDVCKDFKDTGYCGYGDACKFLHDRSDYKTGWQLEKDWEEQQRKQKHDAALAALGEDDAPKKVADDGLPFACLICREPWDKKSSPIVTKCEHYFCEKCALAHFQKTWRCFVCAEQTGGIFNAAKNIQAKIDKRAAQEEADAVPDLSAEDAIADYEAHKKREEEKKAGRSGYSGGWAIV